MSVRSPPQSSQSTNLSLLGPESLGELCNLLVEQLGRVGPHPVGVLLVQLEERLPQAITERYRALTRQHRGDVVNADDRQRRLVLVVLDDDGDGGLVEGGVDAVNGERVVGVGGVA